MVVIWRGREDNQIMGKVRGGGKGRIGEWSMTDLGEAVLLPRLLRFPFFWVY